MGGGYDLVGTVFGDWLEQQYQSRLRPISHRASLINNADIGFTTAVNSGPGTTLYGLTAHVENGSVKYMSLTGACGLGSMVKAANAIGLEVAEDRDKQGNLLGFFITDTYA
jgi:hypothetical protein